jgi:hypothetical protein
MIGMDREWGNEPDLGTDVEVVVDRSGTDTRVVLADANRESAWVSVPERGLCSLGEWR